MREDLTREAVRFAGPRGRLCGELVYATDRPSFACVAFSPHPHMGGTAANPVVTAITDAVATAGGVGLSFDYAGVGASEGTSADPAASLAAFWDTGHAPEDPGMVADGRAAVRWLRRQAGVGGASMCLAGYSFGSHVASHCLAAAGRTAALAMVAPTLAHHDFAPLRTPAAPAAFVVYSDDDFATPLAATLEFLASMPRPPRALLVPGAQHFFRGSEPAIGTAIVDFFAEHCGTLLGVASSSGSAVTPC